MKNQMKYAITERKVLIHCRQCKYVIPMYFAFQTPDYLYMAFKFVPTGDLGKLSFIQVNTFRFMARYLSRKPSFYQQSQSTLWNFFIIARLSIVILSRKIYFLMNKVIFIWSISAWPSNSIINRTQLSLSQELPCTLPLRDLLEAGQLILKATYTVSVVYSMKCFTEKVHSLALTTVPSQTILRILNQTLVIAYLKNIYLS